MLRGLYTAASGLITQQRRHDTVTNNIANINTPGYKGTNSVAHTFPEMMLSLTGVKNEPNTKIGKLTTGVFAEESLALYLQGDLRETNKASDFAILSNIAVDGLTFDAAGKNVSDNGTVTYQPQAYFTIQTADGGVRYTRGGSFTVYEDGILRTSDGSTVLGANGAPIQLPPGVSIESLTLNANHQLVDAGGAVYGQLLISRIDNPYLLVRDGSGHFRYEGNENEVQAIVAAEGVEVRQGYIERSNVDVTQAAIDIMAAMRAYEANQKVIQFYDRSLDKAVNEVGRI